MALAHSPKIVTDGLVFAYDMGNAGKSWKGKPATNFLTNGHFSGGNKITQESGSNPANEIILLRNPGSSEYVLRQTGTVGYTEYQLNLTTELVAATTYVMSGWYAESSNYSCADGSRMFHSRAYSTSGAHIATGNGIGTVLETKVVNGITWKYCYATITTPADYNNVFEWYVGYGGSAYTGHRYYTNLQVEIGTLPSRFVNGTRSNTQALLDLTRQNTITATGLTYASNGSFSFDGSSGYLTTPSRNLGNGDKSWTVSAWVKTTTNAGNTTGHGSILSNQSGGPVYSAMCVNSGKIAYWTYQNSAWTQKLGVGTTVNDGNWHLLTWVNYSNYTMDMYIDGIIDSNVPNSTSGNQNPVDMIGGSWAAKFSGSIDQLSIYNTSLTPEEVRELFNAMRRRYGV